jgi:hypothetical protein
MSTIKHTPGEVGTYPDTALGETLEYDHYEVLAFAELPATGGGRCTHSFPDYLDNKIVAQCKYLDSIGADDAATCVSPCEPTLTKSVTDNSWSRDNPSIELREISNKGWWKASSASRTNSWVSINYSIGSSYENNVVEVADKAACI